MAKQKVIKIDNQDLINLIQSYGYEATSRQDLLAHMISMGMSLEDPSFKAYHKEYQDYFIKFEAAKAELEDKYIKPLLPEDVSVNWNLNYETGECTIIGIE